MKKLIQFIFINSYLLIHMINKKIKRGVYYETQ